MSKGSKSRISDKARYDRNYDEIYDKQMKKAQKEYEKENLYRKFNGGDGCKK